VTEFISFSDKATDEKSGILKDNGFKYSFSRDVFVNVSTGTFTSLEYVEDNPPEKIEILTAPNLTGQPRFAFNNELSENKKDELLREFRYSAPTVQTMRPLEVVTKLTEELTQAEIENEIRKEYQEKQLQYGKLLEYGKDSINSLLKEIKLGLKGFEKIEIDARIKTLPKCINKLKKDNEGKMLGQHASLNALNDIVGVRVAVFPNNRMDDVCSKMKESFPECKEKNEKGRCHKFYIEFDLGLSYKIIEVQVLPSLLSAYWDIEHDLIYKPTDIVFGKLQEEMLNKLDDEVEEFIIKKSSELNEIINPAL